MKVIVQLDVDVNMELDVDLYLGVNVHALPDACPHVHAGAGQLPPGGARELLYA